MYYTKKKLALYMEQENKKELTRIYFRGWKHYRIRNLTTAEIWLKGGIIHQI